MAKKFGYPELRPDGLACTISQLEARSAYPVLSDELRFEHPEMSSKKPRHVGLASTLIMSHSAAKMTELILVSAKLRSDLSIGDDPEAPSRLNTIESPEQYSKEPRPRVPASTITLMSQSKVESVYPACGHERA